VVGLREALGEARIYGDSPTATATFDFQFPWRRRGDEPDGGVLGHAGVPPVEHRVPTEYSQDMEKSNLLLPEEREFHSEQIFQPAGVAKERPLLILRSQRTFEISKQHVPIAAEIRYLVRKDQVGHLSDPSADYRLLPKPSFLIPIPAEFLEV